MSLFISGLYRFDEFELNPARLTFSRQGEPLSISPKAFEVLTYLVANPGRVVTKDELLNAVWPESFVEEGNLTQQVSALRRVLGDRSGLIATVPGRGYQFTAQVHEELQPGTAVVAGSGARGDDNLAQPVRGRALVAETEQAPASGRDAKRARLRWIPWVSVVAAVLIVGAYVVLRESGRSSLRISSYAQLTHDGHPKTIGGTDGNRVYFTEELPHTIAQVSASGGPVEPIPVSVKEPWAGDVSPDGSTMLIVSETGGMGPANSLWSFRLVGESLRQLAIDALDSTWSPDGLRVAYSSTTGDIFVVRNDGTERHKLASPGGYLRSLAWSPDGTKLRFSKNGVLWELGSDGANLHQVLPGWSNSETQFSGQWAQDGRYFFISDRQIWMLDERARLGKFLAGKPVQLTSGPIDWDRPVVSRDGTKIFASGRSKRGELVRFDAKSKQFQPFLGGISAEFVVFTNDGKTVAYVTYPEGILWRADADGSNPLQLTSPPVYPKSLRWSPDGREILFVDRTPNGTNGIYIIAQDGGSPRRVVPDDNENETDPSWSPDGKRIAYSTGPELGETSNSDLRILDLAAGKATLIPGSKGLVVPHWSPDGRFISAVTLDAMSMKVLSLDSGNWSNLDTGPVAFPEWSRDSKFIYYLKWKGDAALLRMHPGDATPEQVADIRTEHFTGFFTTWMSLDSSGAPLLLRDIGSDDIYALTLAGK